MLKLRIKYIFLLLVALVATIAFVIGYSYHVRLQSASSPAPVLSVGVAQVEGARIVSSGVPQGAIPALSSPRFVVANNATSELDAAGSGLAVVYGGMAKFYPYQVLAWHEVVNDVIAGKPVAATYCALCNVGVVYSRTLDGQILSFGVSGKLEELDSLLFDISSESLWSQVTGEALSGSYAGKKLEQLASQPMRLDEFIQKYPLGQVLSRYTGYERDYDTLAYGDYATQSGGDIVIAKKGLLHPKTEVIGVTVNGVTHKAYPLSLFETKNSITDTVDGVVLEIGANGTVDVIGGGNTASKAGDVTHLRTYWFMWQLYRPTTSVYR